MMDNNSFPVTFCPRVLVMLLTLTLFAGAAGAQESSSEDTEGFTDSTELEIQISSRPELKLRLIETMTFPFLQGNGPLTEGNNIETSFAAEASPVSLSGMAEAVWTPVAFFQAAAGARAGSGWNIELFGSGVYGIGINAPRDEGGQGPRKTEVRGEAFDGLLWSAWGGGAFQFDLAALFPGDWTHVLFRTYQEARYSAYTRAVNGESWFFEADFGENRNGWIYYSSYLLGYQMPLSPVLDTVAFMAELKKNLYSDPRGDYWGDNLGEWTLSGLFNFTLGSRFRTALIIQLRTWRNHGSSDLENTGKLYYQDRELKGGYGNRRLAFYRAAFIMSYKLR
jgi:hypothetical protein